MTVDQVVFSYSLATKVGKNSVQNVDFADWVQNADQVENADCRLGTKCRLKIKNVFKYTITCHFVAYQGSHKTPYLCINNRSSMLDMLAICGEYGVFERPALHSFSVI